MQSQNRANIPGRKTSFTSSILHTLMNNAALRLLLPLLLIGWMVLVVYYVNNSSLSTHTNIDNSNLRGATLPVHQIDRIFDNLNEDVTLKHFTHLVLVPGHASMHIEKLSIADTADDAWFLLSYQRKRGYPQIISSHILKGIDILKEDSDAVMFFSGGQTRRDVGPISEAASYYYLGVMKNWITKELSHQVYLEEYARDSFENLLFALCRFHEITGHYPQKITVIGFDFKSKRFSEIHRQAIWYPSDNFTYIGLAAPSPFDQISAENGEKDAYLEFSKDLYGCNDKLLHDKRLLRNPFHRTIPYELSCPDMKELLHYCGSDLISREKIPWALAASGQY